MGPFLSNLWCKKKGILNKKRENTKKGVFDALREGLKVRGRKGEAKE